MAFNKIDNASYLDTDWQSEIVSKNLLKKGYIAIDFTDTNPPQLAAGSAVDIDGVLYQVDADQAITDSGVSDGVVYVYVAGGASGEAHFTNTDIPQYSELHKGYYDGSDNRYIARFIKKGSIWIFDKIFNDSQIESNESTVSLVEKINKNLLTLQEFSTSVFSTSGQIKSIQCSKYGDVLVLTVSSSSSRILRYSNNSLSETDVFTSPTATDLVYEKNSHNYYLLMSDGVIKESDNGGRTWTDFADVGNTSYCFDKLDDIILVGGSDGKVYRSTDGGTSFSTISVEPLDRIAAIKINESGSESGSESGCTAALTIQENAYFSSNAGLSWALAGSSDSELNPAWYIVGGTYDQQCVFAEFEFIITPGSESFLIKILYTSNNGSTWNTKTIAHGQGISGGTIYENIMIIANKSRLLVSNDGVNFSSRAIDQLNITNGTVNYGFRRTEISDNKIFVGNLRTLNVLS